MSEIMKPIPFGELLNQAITEYKNRGTIYYVPVAKINSSIKKVHLSGKMAESPIGPAAGPHTQLAQNVLAAYAAGGRYFELKTVQVLDGEALGIQKPCIYVKDEAYNTEWSTELTSYEALAEYIKAWILLKLLIKEFSWGDPEGFVFNMSVGYNLEGIQSQKIDYFLEHMKDGKETEIFKESIKYTLDNLHLFKNITKEYVENIDSHISNTITLSTMHGCPSKEIEGITTYLLKEKRLNTYLKCNPTLLGAEQVRKILDTMGYDYITFDEGMFEKDISFDAAVDIIKRLITTGKEYGSEFGIKLTNTFPVKIKNNELPGEDMYMSGSPLYPLTIGVAAKLSEAVGSDLRISYSGGADTGNIDAIYKAGIYPITVSTLLLKNSGYKNLTKLNEALAGSEPKDFLKLDVEKIEELAVNAVSDRKYYKPEAKAFKKPTLDYSPFCSKCKNCVDVCPNRANFLMEQDNMKYTVHKDALCNECGNCSCFCVLGHVPYKEKFTVFDSADEFAGSKNPGMYVRNGITTIRWEEFTYKGKLENSLELPEELRGFLKGLENTDWAAC